MQRILQTFGLGSRWERRTHDRSERARTHIAATIFTVQSPEQHTWDETSPWIRKDQQCPLEMRTEVVTVGGSTTKKNAFCSFCRKSYRDVGPLVEGPGDVYICGDCIELCQSILEQEQRRRGSTKQLFNKIPTPREMVAHMDEYVIGQGSAKKVLSVAVHNHYKATFNWLGRQFRCRNRQVQRDAHRSDRFW